MDCTFYNLTNKILSCGSRVEKKKFLKFKNVNNKKYNQIGKEEGMLTPISISLVSSSQNHLGNRETITEGQRHLIRDFTNH